MIKIDKKRVTVILAALIVLATVFFVFSIKGKSDDIARADNNLPVYNSSDDVYEISTATQLINLSQSVNNGTQINGRYYASLSYRLTDDIDLTGYAWTPIGTDEYYYDLYLDVTTPLRNLYDSDLGDEKPKFTPIWEEKYVYLYLDANGSVGANAGYDQTADYYIRYRMPRAFYGEFDGAGYTVSYCAPSSAGNCVGLFGYVKNAYVRDLTVENMQALSLQNSHVGGIAGKVENSVLSGCGTVDSSISSSDDVGGIAGIAARVNDVYSDIAELSAFVQDYSAAKFNTPRETRVESCYSVNNTIYSDSYAAGVVAQSEGNCAIANCFNNSVVNAQERILHYQNEEISVKTAGGIIAGSDGLATVSRCLGVYYVAENGLTKIGAIKSALCGATCYYCYRITDEDLLDGTSIAYADAGATTCDPAYSVSSLQSQLGDTHWLAGGRQSGTTYYYPVPATCDRIVSFQGYTVTENDVFKGLHYPGYVYTYPAAEEAVRLGYTVSKWSDGTVEHDCLSTQVLSADLNVEPIWALNAPVLVLSDAYSFDYDGQTHAVTPAFTHDLPGLTVTYTWTKTNGAPYQASVLSVREVADTAVYTCVAQVTDGVLVALSEQKNLSVTVSAKNLTVEIRLFMNNAQNEAAKTHVYDGSYVSAPIYSASGLIDGHVLAPSYVYKSNNSIISVGDTANVGTYEISANLTVTEGTNDITNNYLLTVVPYAYTVVPADISVVCAYATAWQVAYDGQAHSLTASDFTIGTAGNQPYELTITGSYVNVTTGSPVSYTIVAPNHNAYNGQVALVITPVLLTFTPKNVTFSKIYDGTDAISLSSFAEDGSYTVSHDPCEGQQPAVQIVRAFFSQSNAGENLTVTAVFSVSGDNFVLSSSSIVYPGCSILKKTVTIASSYVFTKTYDGTTTADISALTTNDYQVTDDVGVTPTNGVYNSSHVADATSVTVRFALKPSEQTNYRFSSGNTLEYVFSASITPMNVSITPTSGVTFTKTYDGTNVLDPSLIPTSAYRVSTENDTASAPTVVSALFDSAHANASSLTVSFVLSDDYLLTTPTVEYAASVTPATISLDASALRAVDRPYDGTTFVEITGGALLGVIPGDEVLFDLNGGFIASKDASATPYAVTVNPVVLRSDDYVLDDPTPTGLTVVISRAEPLVRPQFGSSVVYYEYGLPELVLSDGDTIGEIVWDDENTFTIGENLSFTWSFTPQDETNYAPETGSVILTVREDSLTDVRVYAMPDKVSYIAKEPFDTTGMIVYSYWESEKIFRLELNGASGYGFTLTVGDEATTYPGMLHYGDETIYVNYGGYSCPISVTVEKIVLDIPVVGATERAYTGYPLSPAIDNFNETTMAVSGVTSATNAGTYNFSVSLLNTIDYEWSDQTTSTKTYFWSVLPAGKKTLTLGDTLFTYSGEAQTVALRNDNNNDNGFFIAEGDFSATNAGSYTIRINLVNENYYWIDPDDETDFSDVSEKVLVWVIRPRRINKPDIYDAPYIYTGFLLDIVTDTADEYVLSGDLAVTAAGNYAITAKLNNAYDGNTVLYANYVWADDGSSDPYVMPFTVEKKKVDIPSPGIGNVIYNGSAYSVKIRSNPYYTVGGMRQATDAGNYQVTVSLIDKNNYAWADGTTENKAFGWSITPKQVTKPTVLRQNSYSGYEQTAGISISDYYTLGGNVAKDVGSYVATATLKDKINYRWEGGSISDLSIPWEISQSVIVVPDAPKNLLYNGFEQTAYIETNAAYTIAGNVGKDRGSYTATVTLNDTTGYIWNDGTNVPKTFSWGIYGITIVSDDTPSPITASYSLGEPLYTPVRSGYLFDGWYSSPDFAESSLVTSVEELETDVTLYAKWTKTQTIEPLSPDDGSIIKKPSSTLSKSSRDKIIAGAVVLGACIVAALLLLILGKKR